MENERRLLDAATEGDAVRVAALVAAGTSVEAAGDRNRRALHIAALRSDVQLAQTLLDDLGAQVDAVSASGDTALHFAALQGSEALVHLLLQHGADARRLNGMNKTPLMYARRAAVRELLQAAERGEVAAEPPAPPAAVPPPAAVAPAAAVPAVAPNAVEINPRVLEDLVGAGYQRGAVLDAILRVHHGGRDTNSVALVLAEIAKAEAAAAAAAAGDGSALSSSSSSSAAAECKVCFERPVNTVLLPCAHICVCVECGGALTACPICRTAIAQVVRTYAS